MDPSAVVPTVVFFECRREKKRKVINEALELCAVGAILAEGSKASNPSEGDCPRFEFASAKRNNLALCECRRNHKAFFTASQYAILTALFALDCGACKTNRSKVNAAVQTRTIKMPGSSAVTTASFF